MKSLDVLFRPYVETPIFKEILSLVRQNSSGKIWVIGGFVHRNLAAALYDGKFYDADIDFVVEQRNGELRQISGWEIKANSFGAKNYVRKRNKTSITELAKFERSSGTIPSSIENLLGGVPFTVQSLGYDVQCERFIGDVGLAAILEKTIAVKNLPEALWYAEHKGKPLEEILRGKADELGFKIKG